MAPQYTDEQEEGEHVYHRQNVSVCMKLHISSQLLSRISQVNLSVFFLVLLR